MILTYQEAEFLAALFDGTTKYLHKQKHNINDFITAQAFLGYGEMEGADDPAEVAEVMDMMSGEIQVLRRRIFLEFGI
jgi:hypothetical protein